MSEKVLEYFEELEDPRIDRCKKYSLSEILFTILVGSICGMTDYVDIADFCEVHLNWFQEYFDYANGSPSHDTLGRVMRLLCPEKFKTCFLKWSSSLSGKVKGVVSIDGKVSKHSFDHGDSVTALTMISAWSHEAGLVIGQKK
jgi:hypothetical protein